MRNSTVLVVGVVFSIAACLIAASRYQVHGVRVFVSDDGVFVESMLNAGYEYRYSPDRPSKLEIKVFKSALNRELVTRNIFNLSYRVQAIGVDIGGRESVFFNGFCWRGYKSVSADWQTILVDMLGGGDCYIYGEYDLSNKSIINFNVNAEY